MRDILSNIKDIDSFKGARVPVVSNQAARLKESRRRRYDSRTDIRSSLKEGRTRFIPKPIFLCEDRRLRALYIYLILHGVHSSISFNTKTTLLRKLGRSRSWWDKVIASPLFEKYFKIEGGRLSIKALYSCHGMMIAFFGKDKSKEYRERSISFRENNKARIQRIKSNKGIEEDKNINITIQEDYEELRSYVDAQDGRNLMLLSDRIGRKLAHIYGTTRSVSTDNDKRPLAHVLEDRQNRALKNCIEGTDESGCVYSTSRKKNRERTGLSGYAQRKVERQNLESIKTFTDRKVVYSGTPAEAYDFMSGYSQTYYGKPIKVDSRIKQSNGAPLSNVLVQYPNRYKLEGIEHYQTLAYRPGKGDKGVFLRKNKHDRSFGSKLRYTGRTMSKTYEDSLNESSKHWYRWHDQRRWFKHWIEQDDPELINLDYILKTGILNRKTIDLADRNKLVKRLLIEELNVKLRGVTRLVGSYNSKLDRLVNIKASSVNPLEDFKYHSAKIVYKNEYGTPLMTNAHVAGCNEADELFMETMGLICGKYNEKHGESLAESARRTMIYYTEVFNGERKERPNKQAFSARSISTFAKLFGLSEDSYAYYKWKLQKEASRLEAKRSQIQLLLSALNNESESREKYFHLLSEEEFLKIGLEEQEEKYEPYNGDVLQRGCNLKVWDKRGLALSEKVEDRLPLTSKELRAHLLSIITMTSEMNQGMEKVMIKRIATTLKEIDKERQEQPQASTETTDTESFLERWFGGIFDNTNIEDHEERVQSISKKIKEATLSNNSITETSSSGGGIIIRS